MASSSTGSQSHAARIRSHRERIDESLLSLIEDRDPSILYKPAEHVFQAGGKRIRPTILLLVAEAYGSSVLQALPAALAMEVFHNFTLVHDDLMDRDKERRGRPTLHVKWDEGTAILVGDLMMGLSYELLGRVEPVDTQKLYGVFHPMVEQLCAGQALDAAFETEEEVSVDAYLRMIDQKTGALLSAAFKLGAVVGRAPSEEQNHLFEAGKQVGRAFQIQDDLLDLTAEAEEWGKAVGGDLVAGKKTFLTLRTLERAQGSEYDWFARLIHDGGLPSTDVAEARDRMARLGVFEEARTHVEKYTKRAREHLRVLPNTAPADTLLWLVDRLRDRDY